MTTIYNAERRREYKRTQEQHQKPRHAPHSRTRRGDQPPPAERSRAPDTQPATSAGNNGTPPAQDDEPTRSGRSRSPRTSTHSPRKESEKHG